MLATKIRGLPALALILGDGDRTVSAMAPAPERLRSTAAGVVLIADNDGAVNTLLQSVLHRKQLETVAVTDGDEALRVLTERPVALLVCDLDMPRVNGLEVLRRLSAMSSPPPAVVVSGYLDAALERDLAARPGILGVFRKPFDVLAFAELAERAVRGPSASAPEAVG